MVDRELTGDEAQRALSEAMRRTMATKHQRDPTPAELIAFVRKEKADAANDEHAGFRSYRCQMFSFLLTVLEGRRQDEHDDSTAKEPTV